MSQLQSALTRTRDRWQAFWFPEAPLRRLGLFRLAFSLYALVDVLWPSRYMRRYGSVAPTFFHPIAVIKHVALGPANQGITNLVWAVLVVALALSLVGLGTRVALWVATPLYLWWFATFYSYGGVQHGRIAVVFGLAVCAIGPSGLTNSLDSLLKRARAGGSFARRTAPDDRTDPLAGWALRLMMVLVIIAYEFSCYSKIARQGFGWATGHALQRLIVEKHTWLGVRVEHHMGLLVFMQVATLVFEGLAFVLVKRGRVRDCFFLVSGSFHIGTLLLLDINFSGLMLAYLSFYDLEAGADRIKGLARRLFAGSSRARELPAAAV